MNRRPAHRSLRPAALLACGLYLALGGCSNPEEPSGSGGGSGTSADLDFNVYFDTDDSPSSPAAADRSIQFERADGRVSGIVTGGLATTDEIYPSVHGVRGEVVFSRSDPADPAHTEIWTASLTGTDETQLTTLGGENLMPMWDRSGNFIAFSHNGDIWMMDADGTDQRELTSGAELDYDPTWAPDGTQIMFSRHGGPAGEADIYTVSTAPGQQSAVPFLTGPGSQDHPSWHFNGVLYEDDSDGDDEIWWRHNDGTLEKVTENAVEDDDPVWSPNGIFAVFVSGERIYFERLDGMAGASPPVIQRVGSDVANPACHADY